MYRAFVFGKYYPFHLGHKGLIDFALSKCDELYVMVCASDKEQISGKQRLRWIADTYPGIPKLKLVVLEYSESQLPNTSVSSREVSKQWAEIFLKELPSMDLLVTSEDYGAYVAEYMGIKHEPYDPMRALWPVSSTYIRTKPYEYWRFLPESVKPYYVKKVIILGTESTGKTTLCQYLAEYFKATLVPELGRELIANSNSFNMQDLYEVVRQHTHQIQQASQGNSPLLIVDTDVHITNSYAQFIFGSTLHIDKDVYEKNRGDLYLYLNNDVPYFQDGTRLSHQQRDLLDRSHRNILNEQQVELIEIRGSWDERNKIAKKAVESLLKLMGNFE